MKKIYSLIILCAMLTVGCSSESFPRYRHEYTGIITLKGYAKGYGRYGRRHVTTYPVVICSGDDCFNAISFNGDDGDEDFELFLYENMGKKVKIYVDVIARNDHEASYGTFEIIDYEVIK